MNITFHSDLHFDFNHPELTSTDSRGEKIQPASPSDSSDDLPLSSPAELEAMEMIASPKKYG